MTTVVDVFAEAYRLGLMRSLEERLADGGFGLVAGVDEAGRGCLAGPVVAAAVIPRPDRIVPGVDDSKKLSQEGRERLAEAIRDASLAYAVARVSADWIDRINILEATKRAMLESVAALEVSPDFIVTDAVRLSGTEAPCLPVIRGDAVCYAVACASILAKVDRDRLMAEHDRSYPHYGFASNKGYGASEHRRALREFGPSPLHRLTFRSVVPRIDDRRSA